MMRYVCGFLIDSGAQEVVLVKKTHPAWQAGLFNGAIYCTRACAWKHDPTKFMEAK